MRIAVPKPLDELVHDFDINEVISKIPTAKATDEKGRYQPWDEFRWTVAKDENPEFSWLLVKFARNAMLKPVTIGDYTFQFCVPESLQYSLHQIDKEAAGNMGVEEQSAFGKPQKNHYLVRSLMMEEAISSAQLEGAATTRRVAKKLLETEEKPRNKSEIMIVNNYLLMKEAILAKSEKLTPELVLKFHTIATYEAIENDALSGKFRTTDDIFIKNSDQEIIHTPPKAADLTKLIQDLCDFVNTDHHQSATSLFIHPVVKAIIIHFMIGFIHPFGDGNGRTARALFYWFMMKSDYWLFEYISISKLLKKAPVQYGKSYVYTETDALDMTYFIYYQVDIINRSISELHAYIDRKQKEFADFLSRIEQIRTSRILKNFRQIDLLKKAVKEPGKIFSVKEVSHEYGISENTARSDLRELESHRFLLPIKTGKQTEYIAPADLGTRIL